MLNIINNFHELHIRLKILFVISIAVFVVFSITDIIFWYATYDGPRLDLWFSFCSGIIRNCGYLVTMLFIMGLARKNSKS